GPTPIRRRSNGGICPISRSSVINPEGRVARRVVSRLSSVRSGASLHSVPVRRRLTPLGGGMTGSAAPANVLRRCRDRGKGAPPVSDPDESAVRPATIRETLANREFAAVFWSQALSSFGDSVARAAVIAL